jgi:2-methylisocitrate lyase-like PEP mutase family enzyme
MASHSDLAERFLDLHHKGSPLLLANVWDVGSAKLIASLGFDALATTSSGHAGTLGRHDGKVNREETLTHARLLVGATSLPVSADLENGFADSPEEVAETIRLAGETGLAGASIEDFTGDPNDPIYPRDLAVARIEAAAKVAQHVGIVLTARCENHIRDRHDFDDTLDRLRAYEAAGAHVVYAPGLADLDDIRKVTRSVDVPVNVLALPNGPNVAELASAGVARISVGSAFFNVAMNALAQAAREWRDEGTHEFWQGAIGGMAATQEAFD